MDMRRWSPLWVFGGGCLTGAALLGFYVEERLTRPATAADVITERRVADSPPSTAATSRSSEPSSESPLVRDVALVPVDHETDATARESEAGNSVAEVLARLEADYRRQVAPAHAEEHMSPPAASAAPTPQPLTQPTATVAATAPASPKTPEWAPEATRAREVPAEPTSSSAITEEKAPVRVASADNDEGGAAGGKQQDVAAEMRQLAMLQQATLVQQAALVQYLQLLTLSAPRVTTPAPAPRRAPGGRIVAARANSISATDNPWDFQYPPQNH